MVVFFVFSITLAVQRPATPPSDEPPALKAQLESYFKTAGSPQRAAMNKAISEIHSVDQVVSELQKPDFLAGDEKHAAGTWDVELPSGQKAHVQFAKPSQAGRVPAVIQLLAHPLGGAEAAQLGAGFETVWISVSPLIGGSFHQFGRTPADLPALLREFRKRIRVDSDRIYLLGEKDGADAAWVAALMYPNEFAGVIAVSGIPRLPYPQQSFALLLPNLRGTPFLSIWTDDPTGKDSVSVVNKAIADFALAAGLHFETATLAPNQSGATSIPSRVIESATSKARQPQTRVERLFRYLPQGNAGWLRATDLAGDVWTDEQISIAVTSKEDRDAFITETLKQKLFYLSGKIDGQSITIETKRIGAVELRLSPEQIDFTKPVTVVINDRQRFDGVLEPSIKDLLESAYEDWDFQHPVYVRKSFTINAKP